jgi:5'-phosphate synthase pdxT subunit
VVAVRQGRLMATSFHPEVGDDDRVHQLLVEQITQQH